MLIGFDASRAFISDRTGTENYSYQLLKTLAKIDRKNEYIVYVRPNSVIPAKLVPYPDTGAGIHTNKKWIPLSTDTSDQVWDERRDWPLNFHFKTITLPRLWTQVGLALQTFKDNLDVLFVPAHTLPIVRKLGLKTVITVHDLGSEYLPKTHQLKQRLYLSLMQKYQLKTATKIIAVSKATKQDLINRVGIQASKIGVIYEGFDKERFKIKDLRINNRLDSNILIQYGLEKNSYFLFVGTVQPRKNLERVIRAFFSFAPLRGAERRSNLKKRLPRPLGARNDEIQLVIAGSKGWLSDNIYKLPKTLGIENRVKFLGYVPDKDLPALYSEAIALVFPSLFEGFGLPILEAQACACPVITSNISSMPEVAGKGAILVDPYDIDDIAKGMERVKDQGERGKLKSVSSEASLIKTGFENIKRFSWEKCAKETMTILEQVARN